MLERLKDQELLQNCKVQVQLEKAATSKVLDYLIEIDKRRLWIQEGYSSLFDFCVMFLGYSEGEANRRIQAARLSQKVQEVKPLLEQGQISLSSLTLLSPVLTPHNAKALLPKVINQPTRQVEKIIREHFPERARPKEYFQVEIDEELRTLLEKAKQLASEKNDPVFFKKILKAYIERKDHDHFAKLVSNKDIADNDYNIAVSSYVEQENTTEDVDINKLNSEIAEIVIKQNKLRVAIDKIGRAHV